MRWTCRSWPRTRSKAGVPLLQVHNAHIRRWVAQMHGAAAPAAASR
jgi:hypothetical protein